MFLKKYILQKKLLTFRYSRTYIMKRKLMFYLVVLILPQLGITSYADVLMLGAEKNPQGNYSLLQKYSTSGLQNQDHLSANNISFEIDHYSGTFQSNENGGKPRFIIYAWSSPYHENKNANRMKFSEKSTSLGSWIKIS